SAVECSRLHEGAAGDDQGRVRKPAGTAAAAIRDDVVGILGVASRPHVAYPRRKPQGNRGRGERHWPTRARYRPARAESRGRDLTALFGRLVLGHPGCPSIGHAFFLSIEPPARRYRLQSMLL